MSSWLVIILGLIYAAIAVDQAFKGNMAIFIMYICYAISNIGLYMLVE